MTFENGELIEMRKKQIPTSYFDLLVWAIVVQRYDDNDETANETMKAVRRIVRAATRSGRAVVRAHPYYAANKCK